ncbi:uncharacterized protein V6R79_008866 [Siganus canaliculatus]
MWSTNKGLRIRLTAAATKAVANTKTSRFERLNLSAEATLANASALAASSSGRLTSGEFVRQTSGAARLEGRD